jgi:tetratricopeptide (TPR) repeat protein
LRERFGRLGAEGKAQVGAMVAAVTYWFVHSGVEWFWQLPTVTLPAIVYLAMLAAPWRRVEAPPPRWPLRALGAGAALLALLAVAPLYLAYHYNRQSQTAPDAQEALAAVERARRFFPVSPELALQEAKLAVQLDQRERTEDALREAIRLDPENFAPYAVLASFYEGRGELGAALSSYQEALARNPLDPDLNPHVIELLARVPPESVSAHFLGEGAELGRLNLAVSVAPDGEGGPQESATVSPGTGVLFVPPAETVSFRASDTAGPSDVAFLNSEGWILWIWEGPEPGEEVQLEGPYRMAIVAERGFYEENDVRWGNRPSRAVFELAP